jgi:hypothetical protein
MGRNEDWTDKETQILTGMVAEGLTARQIHASNRLPGRTYFAIKKHRLITLAGKIRKPAILTPAVQPAEGPLSIENVVKYFSNAFQQICDLKEVDKLTLERFRIIFQAAKDYGPLLAGYEKWQDIEKQITQLTAAVAELQAAKKAREASR